MAAPDQRSPAMRDPVADGIRALLAAASLCASVAVAADVPRSALAKLAQTGAVDCQPALPYFCSNTHVSCSGRTSLATFAFTLRATAARAWIESTADAPGVMALYENARIDRDQDGTYVIFRPRAAQGYVKLLADGRYSFRHYAQDLGTMSHGHCH